MTPAAVLGFRARAQQLDRDQGGSVTDTAILDYGVQDTGPDGGGWALAIRGLTPPEPRSDQLVLLWTLRGAPHFYRRTDLPSVLAAVAPFSDDDAGKRIFDAATPLRRAGITPLAALDTVADRMRRVVTSPMSKGEVSTQVTRLLDEPYLRYCRRCRATHSYEQTFRLGATRAGLELEPGTSPPVLRPGLPRPARRPRPQHDVIRAYLRLLGPATPAMVARFLDSPVAEVRARWPEDVAEVRVDGEVRWVLAGDTDRLTADPPSAIRLLGPYDLFLQARDRGTLVSGAARAKALWPVLGRPGAVLVDGDLVGTWRPRKSGSRLTVAVQPWGKLPGAVRKRIAAQAELLSAYRGIALAGVDFADA